MAQVQRRFNEADDEGESGIVSDALDAEAAADALRAVWDLETGLLVAFKAQDSLPAAHAHCHVVAMSERLGLTTPRSMMVQASTELETFLTNGSAKTSHPFVLGITNRILNGDPVTSLRAVRQLRERGWAIAVDNPEWGTAALALLPLINPDVITLDLPRLDEMEIAHADDVLNAVGAHAESAGCIVLATGIRTEHDVNRARAMGATLGEGELLDAQQPLTNPLARVSGIAVRPVPTGTDRLRDTPFSIVSERRESRAGSRELLVEMSTLIERRASRAGSSAVVLSTFQHAKNLRGGLVRTYNDLSDTAALVATFVQDVGLNETGNAFTEIHIDEADVLGSQWTVIALSPSYSAVLAAQQTRAAPDGSATYEFIFSRDQRLAIEAARTLTARL